MKTPIEFPCYIKDPDNEITNQEGKRRKSMLTFFKEDVAAIMKGRYTPEELKDVPCTFIYYYNTAEDTVAVSYDEVKKIIFGSSENFLSF